MLDLGEACRAESTVTSQDIAGTPHLMRVQAHDKALAPGWAAQVKPARTNLRRRQPKTRLGWFRKDYAMQRYKLRYNC